MFTGAYIDTAVSLLGQYQGPEPFHLYIKSFFAAHKKFGSRDRKYITQLCYSWFRAGHALQHLEQKQQLVYALFLCTDGESKLLEQLDAELHQYSTKSLDEKCSLLEGRIGFQEHQLFPWNDALSKVINQHLFQRSLLIQPDLFLRLRPGKEEQVIDTLQKHQIPFQKTNEQCLALPNSVKIDAVLKLDEEAVVQDLNSQKVLDLLKEHGLLKKYNVWDCCAASGGKTLLLLDTFPQAQVTVSDVRQNILYNLQGRFKIAGIKTYRWFVADATKEAPPGNQKFDLILCDAPCSGAGTWSRTPEQLHLFRPEKIDAYAVLQKNIVRNVAQYLKPGGLLLYSTCSVFKGENEEVVDFITAHCNMEFLKSAYYRGYDQKADTLFAALFQAL